MATTSRVVFSDDLAWCEECGQSVLGGCSLHTLIRVADRVIPSHARLTLPCSLKLQATGPSQAECGVFAKKLIQKLSNFGPAEGELVGGGAAAAAADYECYHFKIFNCVDGTYKFLNNQNEETCNWMMFVRLAANANEQNLVAYQHNGGIYMTACQVIHPGTELKFWYAKDYAHLVGKPMLAEAAADAAMPDHAAGQPCRKLSPTGSSAVLPEPAVAVVSRQQQQQNSDLLPIGLTKAGLRSFRHKPTPAACMPDRQPGVACWPCDACERVFSTSRQLEQHACDRAQPGVAAAAAADALCTGGATGDGGRRTRNKRKGRPKKVMAVGGRRRRKGAVLVASAAVAAAAVAAASPAGETAAAATVRAITGAAAATGGAPSFSFSSSAAAAVGTTAAMQPRAPLGCRHCTLEFATRGKLLAHVHAQHSAAERPQFQCGLVGCGKSFGSKFKLMRHELIHQPQKRYRCRFCDKPFSRRDHLKNHLVLHDDNRSLHVCSYCRKSYSTLHAYRTHVAYHRALAGEPACSVCLKEFDGREALVAHIKVHAGSRSVRGATEKKFGCSECDKRFFTQKDVRRHQVTHTKEKNFACQLCPQRFGRQDHLTRHLKKNHCATAGATSAAVVGTRSPASYDEEDDILMAAAVAAVGSRSLSRARSSAAAPAAACSVAVGAATTAERSLAVDVATGSMHQHLQVLSGEAQPGMVEVTATIGELTAVDRPAHALPEYVSVSVFPGAMSPGGQHQQYFLFNGFGMSTAAAGSQLGVAAHSECTADRGKGRPGASSGTSSSSSNGSTDGEPQLPAMWQPVLVTASAPAMVAAGDSQVRYRSPAIVNMTAATLMPAPCGQRDSETVILDCSGTLQQSVGQVEGNGCILRPLQPPAAGSADALSAIHLSTRGPAALHADSCCTASATTNDFMEAMKVLGSFNVSAATTPAALQIVQPHSVGLPVQQQHGGTDGIGDLYTAAAQHYAAQGLIYR